MSGWFLVARVTALLLFLPAEWSDKGRGECAAGVKQFGATLGTDQCAIVSVAPPNLSVSCTIHMPDGTLQH